MGLMTGPGKLRIKDFGRSATLFKQVIKLDYTLIIQIINFLVLMVILTRLVFKPITNWLEKREEAIKSAFKDAQEAREKALELETEYNKKLLEARKEAQELHKKIQTEALNEKMRLIEETRKKGEALIQKAKADIQADLEKAKVAIRQQAEAFSNLIVEKILQK
jgi:F-type H+-transporting ATPase subunit b